MKFSPERVKRLDIKSKRPVMFYSQWVKLFDALRKEADHPEALKLLSQYNQCWATSTEFIDVPKNDHEVPEQGMLSSLGYSVAQNNPRHPPINRDSERRFALLKHIWENELPPISDASYKEKWCAPSSSGRLDYMITVLDKLANPKSPSARYGNMKKSIERWKEDSNKLTQFKSYVFPDL